MTDDTDGTEHEELDGNVVRPYMLTRGRTRSEAVTVVMESLVDRREVPDKRVAALQPPQRSIWDLLESTQSAAEISAMLKIPLGVVFVLVGDMAGDGLLDVHASAATDDIQLVRRLIDGVSAL